MPAAVVIGTMTVGTDGPPGATIAGSPNVMIEGRAACTIGHQSHLIFYMEQRSLMAVSLQLVHPM